ncbi:alkaline phosphatase family protein [Amycolatopsis plumensis]|uniref:Alkaline phosphatase family protein n=1 Tax=Amycolatopsis plumensis TaxID=236508 RepID=A0ABV5UI48_9PSEU
MRTPRLLAAVVAAVAMAALVPAAHSAAQTTARPKKVVVLGIDGLLFDKIAPADAPHLDALIASGRSSKTWLYANPMAPTMSGPGWATIATGVWPDKHKVTSNNWGTTTNFAQYPDFLTRLENANPALSTYAITDWSPLTTDSAGRAIFAGAIDKRENVDDSIGVPQADAIVAGRAAAYLKDNGPDASFVYFDAVDAAGHSCGAASSCYTTAINETDKNLGKVLDAVKARATYADEDWTFLVTTDHGHTDAGGHGGSTPPERSSFIIQTGPGIPAGTMAVKPKNVDIAATVLNLFGVGAPLDGQVLGTPAADPFESVTLNSRVDESGIPASVLGWTKSVPSGWSIDNSAMGTGGVTEWRGWSLTTDEFWTRTQPDQQRETNVRARGVFAVADSDEWSDKLVNGSFTSSLMSPRYPVTGKTKATITFGSHYLKEGAETATLAVSFDGGAFQTVLTYPGDVLAKVESVRVSVPSGAAGMVVRWRLADGSNNWYWAVDNPGVTLS